MVISIDTLLIKQLENYWMSFLQLVSTLDKTKDGFNSILPIVSFDSYRNNYKVCCRDSWVFLNVFTGFAEFSDKYMYICHYSKRDGTCHPATSSTRDQDATTASARHMWRTGSLNWAQFMLQWFIWFPEFVEFTEFLFHLGKTPVSQSKENTVIVLMTSTRCLSAENGFLSSTQFIINVLQNSNNNFHDYFANVISVFSIFHDWILNS